MLPLVLESVAANWLLPWSFFNSKKEEKKKNVVMLLLRYSNLNNIFMYKYELLFLTIDRILKQILQMKQIFYSKLL